MLTLIQFNPDERQKPRSFRLADDRAHVIGRRHGDVQLLDSRISRQHAEVSVQNGTWVIRDLSSSNGTWVNGERIEGLCELEEGDRLVIGRITLLVGHVETQTAAAAPAPALADGEATTSAADTAADSIALSDSASPEAKLAADGIEPGLAADQSSDLDAELDLEPIDFSLDDEDPRDASADAAVNPEDPPDAAVASEMQDSADDAPMLSEADLMSLGDSGADGLWGLDASSLAPPLVAADGPDTPAEASDVEQENTPRPSAADRREEVDEYAASVDVVSPIVRPDSPLDQKQGEVDDLASDAVTPSDDVNDLANDLDEGGDAPPVVGLSLDLPSPETLDDHAADALADATGLDHELAHGSGIGTELEENATDEADRSVEVEVDAAAVAEAAPPVSADDAAEREPDWVESESQQDLDPAWSGRRSSRKKAFAVLVMIALAAGGAFWAINSGDTNTPIAGVTPGNSSGTTTANPGNFIPSGTPATPGSPVESDASLTTSQDAVDTSTPRPGDPADLAPPRANASTARDPSTANDSPKSDAFGQSPTLAAPTPRPAQIAPPRSAPTETAQAQPDVNPAVEPQPQPTVTSSDRTAPSSPTANPIETPEAPETPEASPRGDATLAMLDPAPAREADFLNLPDQADTDADRPIVAAGPGQRIVFVIDASGSMVDSMNQGALSWLELRLASLTDQDQFTVLFFRNSEVIEVPPAGLKPADSLEQQRTLAWVAPNAGNIRPRGKSEPINAIQQAQRYQPTDIYILSDDKFGQRRAAAAIEARDLESLLGDRPAKVHTVQFFYPNQDDSELESIAQRFGGTYEFVKEPPFDLDPHNDLGVDLLGISR
ncbi:MAG: FHA domain-containing protein [Planctomycetota bacterium]